MGAVAWQEKDLEGEDHKARVLESEEWIDKLHKWGEAYVLETRLSFKVSTSIATIRRHKKIMGF